MVLKSEKSYWKKLDDANKKDTAYGSYEGAYFSDKVREFAKAFLKEWRCL